MAALEWGGSNDDDRIESLRFNRLCPTFGWQMSEGTLVAKAHLLVFSNPVVGQEDEYHRWHDQVHIPDALTLPGFISATRYGKAPTQMGIDELPYEFVIRYELDLCDMSVLPGLIQGAIADRRMDVSQSISTVGSCVLVQIGDVRTSS